MQRPLLPVNFSHTVKIRRLLCRDGIVLRAVIPDSGAGRCGPLPAGLCAAHTKNGVRKMPDTVSFREEQKRGWGESFC